MTARKERPRAPGIFRWHQGNQAISRVVISLPDTDVHQPKGLGKAELSLHLEPAIGIYRPRQFQGEGEAGGGSRWHPGPVECADLPSTRLREDKRAGLQQVERPSRNDNSDGRIHECLPGAGDWSKYLRSPFLILTVSLKGQVLLCYPFNR